MDAILSLSLFLWIWFIIYHCFSRFHYIYNTSHITGQKMYVYITYKNPISCTYVLHKQEGQFFEAHSPNFFLNNGGDTIFFNSIGKMSHIFGPKLDIVSEPNMTILILLSSSAV